MKKVRLVTTILFCLSLVLSLAVSAAAADGENMFWTGYDDGWDAGYDAGYLAAVEGRTESVGYVSDETIQTYEGGYACGYVSGYDAGIRDALQEIMPEEFWNGYDAGWNEGYEAGYTYANMGRAPDPLEQYVPDYTDSSYEGGYIYGYAEGFRTSYEEYQRVLQWQQAEADAMVAAKLAAGGYENGYNVMVNGQCLKFDVRPENKDGRIFVPFRAIFEALGAQVSYDAQTHTITGSLQDVTIFHAIGTQTLTIRRGEEEINSTMDCASYIKNGRTLVPVRFISEALGWYVTWDSVYQTAVIVDWETICEETDNRAQILNTILKQQLDLEHNTYAQKVRLDIAVREFDTLDGDRVYRMGCTVDSLTNQKGSNVEFELDLRNLLSLAADEQLDAEILQYLQNGIQAEVILRNSDSQMFTTVSGLEYNAWMQTDVRDFTGTDIKLEDGCSVGELLWLLAGEGYTGDPFFLYEEISGTMEQVLAFVGDEVLTKTGNTYRLTWDTESIFQTLVTVGEPETELEEFRETFGNLDISLQIRPNSDGTGNFDLETTWRVDDTLFTLQAGQSGNQGKVTAQIHVKNQFVCDIAAAISTATSREQVKTEPPVGALVVPMN